MITSGSGIFISCVVNTFVLKKNNPTLLSSGKNCNMYTNSSSPFPKLSRSSAYRMLVKRCCNPTLAPWHPRCCFHALIASPKPALNKAGLRTSPCLTHDWLCTGVVSFHTATLRIIKRSQQLNVFFRKPLSVECCKQNWKISNKFVKCLFPAIVRSRTQK